MNKYLKILIISTLVCVIFVSVSGVANARDFIIREQGNPSNVLFKVQGDTGNVGIGTTSPGVELDVDGSFLKIESRGEHTAKTPLLRESFSGDNLYSIDTSWSVEELRKFLVGTSDESDAPGGYSIYSDGSSNSFKKSGGVGAPRIAIEEGAKYYYEFWVKPAVPNTELQTHWGTDDYDEHLNYISSS